MSMRPPRILSICEKEDQGDCVEFREIPQCGIFMYSGKRYVRLADEGQEAWIISGMDLRQNYPADKAKPCNVFCFDTCSFGSFQDHTKVRRMRLEPLKFSV